MAEPLSGLKLAAETAHYHALAKEYADKAAGAPDSQLRGTYRALAESYAAMADANEGLMRLMSGEY